MSRLLRLAALAAGAAPSLIADVGIKTRELAPAAKPVYFLGMSSATARLLEEFDRLPTEEQREFSALIVHRAAHFDYGDITDEELTASAATIFTMLDEEEDAQAR